MKKFSIYLLLLALITGVTGCTEWLDVNQNPNDLTQSTKDLVLTGAQKTFGERHHMGSSAGYGALYSAWIGYTAHSGGWSGWNNVKSYNMTSSDYNADFNNAYRNELKSLKYVEEKAVEEANGAYIAVAKILQTAAYQRLVDIYGDIPYSEAVQGFEQNVTPVYDDAQAIYDDFVSKLDTAILLLNEAEELGLHIDQDADIMMHGDIEEWIQYANTLKLRVLIRQSEVRDGYIKSNLSFDEAGFITDHVTSNPGYLENTDGKMNPLYAGYGKNYKGDLTGANQQYGLNIFLSELYKSANDPRLQLAWEPGVETGDYSHALQLGQNGDPLDHWGEGSVRMGPGIYGTSTDGMMVMSMMEANFLIAEALARGYDLSSAGVSGTAKEYWTAGIEASIEYYGDRKDVDTDDLITEYFEGLGGDHAWDDSNPVRSIIYQKYLAGVGVYPYEAWADYRRTGYPEAGDPNVIESSMISYYFNIVRPQVPVRMLYPQRETDINEENVTAAINKTGVGYGSEFIMDAKIFWDAN